jgi:hypothetical protein
MVGTKISMPEISLNTRDLPSVAVAYSRRNVLSEMFHTKLVLRPLRIQRDVSSFAILHKYSIANHVLHTVYYMSHIHIKILSVVTDSQDRHNTLKQKTAYSFVT